MKQVIQGLEEGLGAIAEALSGGSGSYPEPTTATSGQVLTADGEGGADWEDAPSGLPSTEGASEGDVLAVDGNGDPAWTTPDSGLPTITEYDNGKVLTALYDDKSGIGHADWLNPSGGSGLTIDTYSIDATDFTQEGTGYVAVFDSQGAFTYSVADIVSARIYYTGACSLSCSIHYIDKTGWAVAISADDYNTMGSASGFTLKICLQVAI